MLGPERRVTLQARLVPLLHHTSHRPSLAKCNAISNVARGQCISFHGPGSNTAAFLQMIGRLGTDGVLDSVGALWFGQILKAVGHCQSFGLLVCPVRRGAHRWPLGEACKLCLVDPVKLEDGIPRIRLLDRLPLARNA